MKEHMTATPHPKPRARIKDPALLRRFRMRSTVCAICGGAYPGQCDPHHVYPKGRGGDDVEANLVALCRECHDEIEDWRPEVRKWLGQHLRRDRPDVLDYLERKLGKSPADAFFRDSFGG